MGIHVQLQRSEQAIVGCRNSPFTGQKVVALSGLKAESAIIADRAAGDPWLD